MHHKKRSRARPVQDEDQRTKPPVERTPMFLKKNSPKYCKKRKGPHTYEFFKSTKYNQRIVERDGTTKVSVLFFLEDKCTACGKLKKRLKEKTE